MIRRPPRSTQSRSSAASDVYKRQLLHGVGEDFFTQLLPYSHILVIPKDITVRKPYVLQVIRPHLIQLPLVSGELVLHGPAVLTSLCPFRSNMELVGIGDQVRCQFRSRDMLLRLARQSQGEQGTHPLDPGIRHISVWKRGITPAGTVDILAHAEAIPRSGQSGQVALHRSVYGQRSLDFGSGSLTIVTGGQLQHEAVLSDLYLPEMTGQESHVRLIRRGSRQVATKETLSHLRLYHQATLMVQTAHPRGAVELQHIRPELLPE